MTPYNNAVPASSGSGKAPGSRAPSLKRSGSQRRQRRYFIRIACDESEYRVITGLTRSSYGRAVMLGTPGPRAQRTPPVNALELANAKAALSKIGSNINQIAHVLNAGGAISMAQECVDTLAVIRQAVRTMIDAASRGKRDDRQGQPA